MMKITKTPLRTAFSAAMMAAIGFIVLGSVSLLAQTTYEWTGSGDGETYGLSTNWDPSGVPVNVDNVRFLLNPTYTVTFDDDEQVSTTYFENGSPTLDLTAQHTFTTGQLRIASGTFLTITGGTVDQTTTTDTSWIGRATGATPGGSGEMLVTGPDTHFSAAYIRVGQQNRGVLRFEDGASGAFSSSSVRFTIGRASGGYGTLLISGTNLDDPLTPKRSSVTTSGQLFAASMSASQGAVFVEDGGELITGGTLFLANDNGQAIAVSSGAGSEIVAAGGINVSSSVAGAQESWLISNSGGHVTTDGDISIYAAGNVGGNSTIELTSGGVLRNGGLVMPGDPDLSYSNLSVSRTYTSAIGSLTIDGDYIQQLVVGEDTLLGTLRIKVASESSHDHVHVTGDVTLMGTLDLTEFGSATLFQGDELQLLTWDGTLSGTFGDIQTFDLGEELSWDFDRLYTEGIVAVIPEPSTFAITLAFLAAGALLLRRRR